MDNKHLIGKHIFKLEIPAVENAYAIHQRMSDLVWKELVPKMATLFDDIVRPDEMLRIETIEIDLGIIKLEEINGTEIVAKIIQLLNKRCAEAMHFSIDQPKLDVKLLINQARQPLPNYYFELWLHWLEKGVLPSYTLGPKEDWLLGVFEILGVEDVAITRLQMLLKQNPLALNRIVLQHKPKDLKSLVELYTGHSQTQLVRFFKELKSFFKKEVSVSKQFSFREIEVLLWKRIFKKVILKREKLTSNHLTALLIQYSEIITYASKFHKKDKEYIDAYPLLSKAFQQTNENVQDDSNYKTNDRKLEKEERQQQSLQKENLENNAKTRFDTKEFSAEEKPQTADDKSIFNRLEDTFSDSAETLSPQFFKNAGMVLLHPFLTSFFKKLDLLEGAVFKDFESQSKAVLLLHFLASDTEETADYNMVLPKFLCNIPVNIPLDYTLSLSKTEKREAKKLLQAVIDHWEALGSTSPVGLQEGFLIREGKLEKEQSGWKLYVAQETLDILLDSIPWNISMIKLPWMKEMLKVVWR